MDLAGSSHSVPETNFPAPLGRARGLQPIDYQPGSVEVTRPHLCAYSVSLTHDIMYLNPKFTYLVLTL